MFAGGQLSVNTAMLRDNKIILSSQTCITKRHELKNFLLCVSIPIHRRQWLVCVSAWSLMRTGPRCGN